jgi:hypothetical protein
VKHETTETETKTAQQYLDALDRFVDLPQNQTNDNAYLDTILRFYVDHPDEATSVLRMILPKVKTLSNSSVRAMGQMAALAFPDASFPYIEFADNNRVPATQVRSWFSEVVYPAAALAWMKRQFGRLVYAGVWTHLKGQDDLCKGTTLSEEVENCSATVWTWAALPENLDSLMRERSERPTRIGTRLKAYACSNIARTWKTLALRAKQKEPVIVAVADIEQKPAKGTRSVVIGGTPTSEQASRVTAMLCVQCDGLQPVISEAEDAVQLACGHSRGINSPGIAPAK